VATAKLKTTAILNGFGRTLGDNIIGLQALETAIHLGTDLGSPILYRLPGLSPVIEDLFKLADFAEIRDLPWAYSTRDTVFELGSSHERIIDIRDFALDKSFQRASMIDYFLGHLGLDPNLVPAGMKRNKWLSRRLTLTKPGLPDGFILICPTSGYDLRSMPKEIHEALLWQLEGHGPLVTQGSIPKGLEGRAISRPKENSLEDLCNLIAHARLVISTDTAMVHLADAVEVPCLAFFPTHDPTWRIRDYPLCTAVPLAGAEPLGLEFARTPDDWATARRAWSPVCKDLSWLTANALRTVA
jgi:Glycosyltransferase family 9 (heptosyltransferase)